MGLWEAMRARTQPKRNNLDALFHVPSAAITLQTALGFEPTGTGSVCYRSAAGAAFAQTQADVLALLRDDAEAPDVEVTQDDFGFTWLVVAGDPADPSGLCTDLHAVNTTLELNGFESGLLCSMVPFANASGQRFGLTYLYKQGTFYPFAPSGERPATRCWSCPCVTCWERSCPWSRTCSGGWRSGRLRGCEPR